MHAQVLVHEQGIERGRVKPGQEHVHHNDKVNLAVLNPLGQILVVVFKGFGIIRVIVGREHLVVIRNRARQKLQVIHGELGGIEVFILNDVHVTVRI